MDYGRIKEDNGLYLYETNNYVNNRVKLYFRLNNDLKTIYTSQLLMYMFTEENEVLGLSNEIINKGKNLYNPLYTFGVDNEGGQLVFIVKFDYIRKDIVEEDYYSELFKFFNDVIYKVKFSDKNLSNCKRSLLSSIKNAISKKENYISSIYLENRVKDSLLSNFNPSSVEGIIDIIDSITLDDVKDLYKKVFSDECFYRGYVFGDISDYEYREIRTLFPFKTSMDILDYSDDEVSNNDDMEIESDLYKESKLYVTYQYNDKNMLFLRFLDKSLNTTVGELHKVLREKYGLVYNSYCSMHLNNNMLYVTSGIASDKKEETLQAIDEVFDNLHEEKVFNKYLEKAIESAREDILILEEKASRMYIAIEKYILKRNNAYDYYDYLEFLENYSYKEYIKELDSIKKNGTFFYKGVK